MVLCIALSFINKSNVELETDFGHGAYDEELVTGGYVARQMALSGTYMDMDMSGMVAAGLEENEEDVRLIRASNSNSNMLSASSSSSQLLQRQQQQ